MRPFYVGDEHTVHPVKDDLADKVRAEPYNIEKLKAYRIAYHFWIDNDAKTGEPDVVGYLAKGEMPPSFFSMVVVKGTFWKGDILWKGGIRGHTGCIELGEWMKQGSGSSWIPQDS